MILTQFLQLTAQQLTRKYSFQPITPGYEKSGVFHFRESPLKKTKSVNAYNPVPAIINHKPVSFCCSIVKALHSNISNTRKAMPAAVIMAAHIPKKIIFISKRACRSAGTRRKPATNILMCITRLNQALIAATSIE